MEKKNGFAWLYISIISFFLMSASFLLMPIDFAKNGAKIVNILVGIMFWLFLVLGIVSQVLLSRNKNNWLAKNRVRRFSAKKKIGLISFCQNIPACAADCLTLVGLIGLVVSVLATDGMGYICYVFMTLFVFAFCLHCIFNGKAYYVLTNQNKILNDTESKHKEEREKE